MGMKSKKRCFPPCINCGGKYHNVSTLKNYGVITCPPQLMVSCVQCEYRTVVTMTDCRTMEEAVRQWKGEIGD